ncbi:MAG: hypothetical protein Q8N28_00415 [bacterium]|nr:hypothetical protein [bacterium]
MKHWRNKKIILILAAVIFFSVCGFEVAYANTAITEITSGAVYFVALAISYLAGKIGAVFYTVIAGLLDIALQVNALILSSPVVLKGWEIVLSFTNLGFVLAIIVIAFATIFRLESYAMKQVLWKLIVAALLVNFSLVIAGAFINVADNVTASFNDKIKGTDLSTALTNLLQVQNLVEPVWQKMSGAERFSRSVLKTLDAVLGSATYVATGGQFTTYIEQTAWGDTESAAAIIVGEKGMTSESLLVMIASLFFSVLFTFLSAFTLLAITIMLLIRYFYLGILLILSPIVWLLWIFPGTSNLWQKWWNNFLRWTFFAPIMMFFLYLAIASIAPGGGLGDTRSQEIISQSAQQSIQRTAEGLSEKQKGGLPADIAKLGNLTLALGLIMAGLIAANSLGITGAKVAMGAAQSAGKWAGGFVGRKGLALGTRPLRGKWGDKATGAMQKTGLGWGKLRFLGAPIRHLGGLGRRVGIQQGDKLVKEAEGRINKRFSSDKELAQSFSTLSRDEQVAAVKRLTKNKKTHFLDSRDIDRIKTSGVWDKGYFGAKRTFERHGAANVYEDFEKATGSNREMAIAEEKYGKGSTQHIKASDNFHSIFDKEDWNNIHPSALADKKHGDIITENLLKSSPGSLPKILSKTKGKDMRDVTKKIKDTEEKIVREASQELDEIIKSIDSSIDIGATGLMDIDKKLEWIKEKDENKYKAIKDEHKRVPKMRKSIEKHFAGRFFEAEEKVKEKEEGEEKEEKKKT